jgi:hypothetical protein
MTPVEQHVADAARTPWAQVAGVSGGLAVVVTNGYARKTLSVIYQGAKAVREARMPLEMPDLDPTNPEAALLALRQACDAALADLKATR